MICKTRICAKGFTGRKDGLVSSPLVWIAHATKQIIATIIIIRTPIKTFFRSSSKLYAVTMENGMRLLSCFPAAGE